MIYLTMAIVIPCIMGFISWQHRSNYITTAVYTLVTAVCITMVVLCAFVKTNITLESEAQLFKYGFLAALVSWGKAGPHCHSMTKRSTQQNAFQLVVYVCVCVAESSRQLPDGHVHRPRALLEELPFALFLLQSPDSPVLTALCTYM